VARIDGRVVFVHGAIDGELCEIKLIKVTDRISWGRIERILEPSPHRQEPECPCYKKCGGCSFMHMRYEHELEIKRTAVDDALRRIGGLELRTSAITPSPEEKRYRNKAIYAVGMSGGEIVTGFYRSRSHDVTPAEDCLIQTESSKRAADAVRRWMREFSIAPYDEKTSRGLVRHVFCRCGMGTGQVQVTVVAADDVPEKAALISLVKSVCPETESVVLNINTSRGNTVLAGEFVTLWGKPSIEDTLCGLRFELSPRSFYQVNRSQAERLYEKALEFAAPGPEDTALDMYCGAGTISLCLAKRAGQVIGAEIVPEAVENARKNAKRNGIENARFLCADASDAARSLSEGGIRPGVIVVAPPRKGLAEDVVSTLAGMGAARIVYVSCDPATLARDLKRFAALGYGAKRAEAFDMFPRCGHVECVTLMSKVEK
jgi:23S rRNA (uracil1939-C5)-methyltransferase